MNCFISKKRIHSLIAGTLAVIILSLSLVGCQNNTLAEVMSPQSASSKVSSAQNTISSQVTSSAPQEISSSQQTSSPATVNSVQKDQQKSTEAKSGTASTGVKKIADSQLAQNSPRLNVIQSKAFASSAYPYIDQRNGYNSLPDLVSRSLYSQIAKSVYKVTAVATADGYYPTQRITVSGFQLSEAQLRLALIAYLNDNPQVFWIVNVYSYGYSDNNNDTYVQLYSYVPQSQCNTMIQQVNAKVSAVMKAMPLGLSEFDRELYLFDYITKTCTYDTAAATDTSLWKSFNAYGALINGKVVCEGYARAMQLLSSYSNLQSILVTGQGSGVNHMWNLMKINANWYHLDITWCDNDTPIYNYFNVTDAVITQTHTVSPNASTLTDDQIDGSTTGAATQCNLALPVCTATEANYFITKGTHITDLNGTDDNAIIAAISAAVKQKKQAVSFYVDPSTDFASVLSAMVQSSPFKLVSYLNSVNSEAGMTNQVNVSNVKYITDQADRGFTIFLSYK